MPVSLLTIKAPQRSFLSRVLRLGRREAAAVAAWNSIALADNYLAVTKETVSAILERRGGSPQNCREHFMEFMGETIEAALRDGRLDDDEHEVLAYLCEILELDGDLVTGLYKSKAHSIVQAAIASMVDQGYVSPDDDERLSGLAEGLRVELSFPPDTEALLDKLRLNYRIQQGELSEIAVDISLPRAERCFGVRHGVDWYETRRATRRVSYGGPTARIKIMKGVYYRVGSMGVQTKSQDEWRRLDSGTLYLTNKRLLFLGTSLNKTIRLSQIVAHVAYLDGIEILKGAGKNPRLLFDKDPDTFGLLLQALIDAQN